MGILATGIVKEKHDVIIMAYIVLKEVSGYYIYPVNIKFFTSS
jgi:hypothetical protein